MAVLVEAISIVIRKDSIDRVYPGGYQAFAADVPNATLCDDDVLARVGFLTAAEAEAFAVTLEAHGLVHVADGEAVDFSFVDQVDGLMECCRWLSFGGFQCGGEGRIAACWFCDNPWVHWGAVAPDVIMTLATPVDWTYERSLSWAVDAGKARRLKVGTGGAHLTSLTGMPMPKPAPFSPNHDRFH